MESFFEHLFQFNVQYYNEVYYYAISRKLHDFKWNWELLDYIFKPRANKGNFNGSFLDLSESVIIVRPCECFLWLKLLLYNYALFLCDYIMLRCIAVLSSYYNIGLVNSPQCKYKVSKVWFSIVNW